MSTIVIFDIFGAKIQILKIFFFQGTLWANTYPQCELQISDFCT